MKKHPDLRNIADHPEEVKHVVHFLRYTARKYLPQAGELPEPQQSSKDSSGRRVAWYLERTLQVVRECSTKEQLKYTLSTTTTVAEIVDCEGFPLLLRVGAEHVPDAVVMT